MKNWCGFNWYRPICVSYKHRGSCQNFTFLEYPIPEIPDDSEKRSGMDWVLPKIIGSGRVSGTRQSLRGGWRSEEWKHYWWDSFPRILPRSCFTGHFPCLFLQQALRLSCRFDYTPVCFQIQTFTDLNHKRLNECTKYIVHTLLLSNICVMNRMQNCSGYYTWPSSLNVKWIEKKKTFSCSVIARELSSVGIKSIVERPNPNPKEI